MGERRTFLLWWSWMSLQEQLLLTVRYLWGNLFRKPECPQLSRHLSLMLFQNNSKQKLEMPQHAPPSAEHGCRDKQTVTAINHDGLRHHSCLLRWYRHGPRHKKHLFFSLTWWCQRKRNDGLDARAVKKISSRCLSPVNQWRWDN